MTVTTLSSMEFDKRFRNNKNLYLLSIQGYSSRNQMQMDYGQSSTLQQQQQLHPGADYPLPELSGDMGLDPLLPPGQNADQDQLEWLDTDI